MIYLYVTYQYFLVSPCLPFGKGTIRLNSKLNARQVKAETAIYLDYSVKRIMSDTISTKRAKAVA